MNLLCNYLVNVQKYYVQRPNIFFLSSQEKCQSSLLTRSPRWIDGTFCGSMFSLERALSSPAVSSLPLSCLLLPLSCRAGLPPPLTVHRRPCLPPLLTCHLTKFCNLPSPHRDRPALALSETLWCALIMFLFSCNPLCFLLKLLIVGLYPEHLHVFATLGLDESTAYLLSSPSAGRLPSRHHTLSLVDLPAVWHCLALHSADYAFPSTECQSLTSAQGSSQSIPSTLLAPTHTSVITLSLGAISWEHSLTQGTEF